MDVNYLSTNSTAVKPTVAEREYVFIPDTPATVDGKKQIIDTSFKLDYNKYNVELAEIKDVLGLSVEANLDVIFTVKTQDNKTLYTSTASIPLAKEAFSIENKVKDSTNPLGIEKEETEINSAKLLVGLLIIIISGMKAFKVADKSLNVIIGRLSPGIMITDFITNALGDKGKIELPEKTKKVYNILGDYPDVVATFLVENMLKNTKNNAHIEWLTNSKAAWRFMTAGFNKRDFFKDK